MTNDPNVSRPYASPTALAEDAEVSRADKVAALKDWRQRIQRKLDSASEGMMPEPTSAEVKGNAPDPITSDAELLRKIDLELEKLVD